MQNFFLQLQKKLVAANREVLLALRTNFDKPDVMKTEFKKLQRKYYYISLQSVKMIIIYGLTLKC